jgi:hypothetical protein
VFAFVFVFVFGLLTSALQRPQHAIHIHALHCLHGCGGGGGIWYGTVLEGEGEDQEEVVCFVSSGLWVFILRCGAVCLSAGSLVRLDAAVCMLCCAACRYYRPPRVQGPVH